MCCYAGDVTDLTHSDLSSNADSVVLVGQMSYCKKCHTHVLIAHQHHILGHHSFEIDFVRNFLKVSDM